MCVSTDGQYIAFESDASNLVPDDTNGKRDIFLRDTVAGTTKRVSVAEDGTQADDDSYGASMSSDGRYVAFASWASNLVAKDWNDTVDVFVRDTQTGTMIPISGAAVNTQWLKPSESPSISADGRYVAFQSAASNLVAGDTNGQWDVFVRDTVLGSTTRVSVATNGTQANSGCGSPSISGDGRYIAFDANASSLVADDTNAQMDIFVRDTVEDTTARISVSSGGVQGNQQSFSPLMSADCRSVAFCSDASNLIANDTNGFRDVFVRNLVEGTTELVSVASDDSPGNEHSSSFSISAEGRFIAFTSAASNLVAGDTNGYRDIFVRDMKSGTTAKATMSAGATGANAHSQDPAISPEGRFVAFLSWADNLVEGDTNGTWDVFVSGPMLPLFTLADVAQCMRFASGLASPSGSEVARLNVDTGSASLTMADAVCIARKAAGLEANP